MDRMAAPPNDSKLADPNRATSPVAQETVPPKDDAPKASPQEATAKRPREMPREIGGPTGPEPTRYGDWERNGRVSDF
jgi:hypothetical protein